MSDTSLIVVEVAYDPDGNPVVHIDGWSPLQTPLMQSVATEGLDTYMITSGVAWDTVDATKAAIKARIDAGSSSPVMKSHLDALGITSAVEAWASQ
tara:strand:+ start:203 stop:490 length:288 start_codon:yes stop_codon:yes gene_type:complete